MMRQLMFRGAAAMVMATALAVSPAAAQDKTPAPKLLPPNVYLYVAAPDAAVLKERMGQSSFGALLRDPALQPTYDQIKGKLSEGAGKVEEKLGVTVDDLLKVPAGEVAMAICDVPGEGIGYVLLVDYGDNQATVDKLVQKAESELEGKGATRKVEEFEGTEIVVYETKKEASSEDDLDIEGEESASSGAADTVAWFRKDNRVVLGNDTPVLEAVLARWDGSHGETLAQSEIFEYIANRTMTDERAPVLAWYANPMGGLQTALSRAENIPPQFQLVAGILPMLGLTNLKGVGGSVDVATEEFDSVSKTFLYVEAPPSGDLGLLGVFRFTPADLAPPEWVSDSAAAYFGAKWDVSGAVSSVQKLVNTFQGPGAFEQLMQRAANAPNGPKLNPQTDLLDQLSGEIHVASYPVVVNRATAEPAAPQQPTVAALGVKNEQAMIDVLARLAQTPNFPGESRQFEGATIYELPTNNAESKMAVTVAKGNLIFATDITRLESVLRTGNGTPLVETESYEKISSHFPDEVTMISFGNQRDQLRTIYEALRTGENPQLSAQFDFSTLPPFDDISKYLRATGSYATPDENGSLLVNFSLKMNE